MTTQIDLLINQIVPDISVKQTGEATFSTCATAKMAGVDESTLRQHWSTGSSTSKLCKMLIEKGFAPQGFSSNGVPDKAVSVIIAYYAFHAGARCTDTAKYVFERFAEVGIRKFAHQLTGWVDDTSASTMVVTTDRIMGLIDRVEANNIALENNNRLLMAQVEEKTQALVTATREIERLKDVFEKNPGLKEAFDYAQNNPNEVGEFTIASFCSNFAFNLERGVRSAIGRLLTSWIELTTRERLPKNAVGHKIYPMKYLPMARLALRHVTGRIV
jgi:hypothetical protein